MDLSFQLPATSFQLITPSCWQLVALAFWFRRPMDAASYPRQSVEIV